MAAAAVAGLIPVLHSVAGDKSSYYVGRQLWFGFIAVYGVVVYVVRMPWADLHQDFWCHGSITYPCLIECFESSFSSPVVGLWYFFFFLFLAFFFLMEFFMAQVRHKQIKAKLVESEAADVEEGSMVGVQEQVPSPKKAAPNFHQEKALLLLYLLHFLLQVGSQGVFLFLLHYRHLPLVSQATIRCSTGSCPGPYFCLVRGSIEKRMSIYTLVTLSFMIILFCSGFFMYSVHHYLLKGLRVPSIGLTDGGQLRSLNSVCQSPPSSFTE
ncbi:hypothetical protein Cadr_000029467 [Camelus dromedarius]|uniref:Connexin N-terminal domain-containing protein n=12 Tax=Camelus TaxID=9836 RepID=A0A5N4C6I6_CAMDR|nr:uncharacterized protein LOC105100745 [Camelus dromedarius]XP_010992100.1 uncharacterized protein LOC105100745 [Camelus dromedarius]XP_031300293.1 uncharacterized protein LOC105100745 [Camelus dromedarius]XP_031300294.1 uncharacterized protein LOC105100745 [Camelus dromedarius]XP_031300295.1 uncharacterized protein LOC105100745 [Camelus dromedarius]XP_031300296.1 uncharacterized protein LOC105100745 [Camelus dromedarius]XP_031300297.1 uncharacterized protein LOC105100745 [Camelus dromedariu